MKNWIRLSKFATAAVLLAGCEKSADSFSLMSDVSSFKQSSAFVPRDIDILWVIDNSGSMKSSQDNLAANFNSFINRFSQLNSNFHMGVVTTDAFLAYHYNNNNRSKLRDGVGSTHSGVFIMDKNTPNLSQVFITNISQGTSGLADERAFSSFEHALGNPLNAGFRRNGAFLSVIIVSDEDDFSHYDWQNGTNSYFATTNYSDPGIFPLSRFTGYLDTLTGTVPGSSVRNYSVSAISVNDQACLDLLNAQNPGRRLGLRYQQLADLTGGKKGSLCSDFGNTLTSIAESIVELSTAFKLDREPYPESIQVVVNGSVVPQNAANGWSYDAASWTLTFHGTGIPPQDANVQIYFDPKSVQL